MSVSYRDIKEFLSHARNLYYDEYDPSDKKTKLYPKLSYGYNYISIILTRDNMNHFNDVKSLKQLINNNLIEDRVFDEIIYFIETGKYPENLPKQIHDKFVNNDLSLCLEINFDFTISEKEKYNLYLITTLVHATSERITSMEFFDNIDRNYVIITSETREYIEKCLKSVEKERKFRNIQKYLENQANKYTSEYDHTEKTKDYPLLGYYYVYISGELEYSRDESLFESIKKLKEYINNSNIPDEIFNNIIAYVRSGKREEEISSSFQGCKKNEHIQEILSAKMTREEFLNNPENYLAMISIGTLEDEVKDPHYFLENRIDYITPNVLRTINTSFKKNKLTEDELKSYDERIEWDTIIGNDEKAKEIIGYWKKIIEKTDDKENIKILQSYNNILKIEIPTKGAISIMLNAQTNFEMFLERFHLEIRGRITTLIDINFFNFVIFQHKPKGEVSLVVVTPSE